MKEDARRKLYLRIALRLLLFVAVALILVFVVPWLFELFTPFIFAFLMAAALNPVVRFLNKKFRISRKWSSSILVILVFMLVAAVISWTVYALTREMVTLAQNIDGVINSVIAAFESLNQRLYWVVDIIPGETDAMIAGFLESVLVWLQNIVVRIADYMVTNTWDITVGIGNWLVALIMFLLAAGFATIDYPKYSEKLSDVKSNWLRMVKKATKQAFSGYIKAQFLLATLAAIVMYIGLIAYGQNYALIIALVLWIIDFLPILGTGSWMVPWSIIVLIGGDIPKAIYLISLQGAFFVVRRILEPKVMGKQMNLSPLLALISIYVGMKLAGIWGMILGPVITIIVISIGKEGVFDGALNDIKAVVEDIKGIFASEKTKANTKSQ